MKLFVLQVEANNACRVKTQRDGFGAPGNQIVDAWRLEWTMSHLIIVFYHWPLLFTVIIRAFKISEANGIEFFIIVMSSLCQVS